MTVIGLVLLPVLCCGLVPLLITAGIFGALGSLLGNPWVIGTAVPLALGAIVLLVRRHSRRSAGTDCCPPNDVEEA